MFFWVARVSGGLAGCCCFDVGDGTPFFFLGVGRMAGSCRHVPPPRTSTALKHDGWKTIFLVK